MRRVRAILVLTAALWVLPAAAPGHPGHRERVLIQDMAFRPAESTIAQGQAVFWSWNGEDRNHSVTADPGQSESFDSDPGEAPGEVSHNLGEDYWHTFSQSGRFTYHCKVHPEMRGVVNVIPPPPRDLYPPSLTAVAMRPKRICTRRGRGCRRARASVRYTLNERAYLTISVEARRRGRWIPLRASRDFAGPGIERRRVSLRGLRRGRHRVRLVAQDASGNLSRAVAATFVVGVPSRPSG